MALEEETKTTMKDNDVKKMLKVIQNYMIKWTLGPIKIRRGICPIGDRLQIGGPICIRAYKECVTVSKAVLLEIIRSPN